MRSIEQCLAEINVRLERLQPVKVTDRSPWNWYAPSCPCDLPAGECRTHPRARGTQRPPEGDWRVWGYVAGAGPGRRGRGGVDSATGQRVHDEARVPDRADRQRHSRRDGRGALRALERRAAVAAAEVRTIEAQSDLAQRRTGNLPERRGARARRGLNIDTIWADELACWQRAESTWDLVMLALRAGANPQALITTTPRRLAVLRRIMTEPTTVQTTDTTYANQAHLPKEFLNQIVSLYENTRLGRQEIYAEFLETTEGVWFTNFDPKRHVSEEAEYHPAYRVRCAIDAGTSRHTAAVFFQVRTNPGSERPHVTVFGDYLAVDQVSHRNALAIKARADELPCRGRLEVVRLDPAAVARSSLGPAAYGEYERVFGPRITARWPQHLVLDGLDTIELLLDSGNLTIHPRCVKLKEAFANYCRQRRGGEWIDFPEDGHPEEDLIDALRGGIRDAMPEGNAVKPGLPRIHASRLG